MFKPHLHLIALFAAALLARLAVGASPPQVSHGISADGRVVSSRYGVAPPWGADVTRLVNPTYPQSMRAQHPIVTGFYRLILDLPKGRVRRVIIQQSSGYSATDSAIVAALQQWQLRPNRWREFEVHVTLGYGKKPKNI